MQQQPGVFDFIPRYATPVFGGATERKEYRGEYGGRMEWWEV